MISNFRHVLNVVCFLLGNSRRLNFICRRFGTLCLFHLYSQVSVEFYTYLPIKMEQTECSEMSAYEIQLLGNYPEESIKYRVIHKSLRDFRTRLRNNQYRHGRKEHING